MAALSFVLDASVALGWCFEDERTPETIAVLDRLVESGAVVPLIWALEAMNGLLVAERRGRIDRAKRQHYAEFLAAFPIREDTGGAGRAWGAVSVLAERCGLTMYDAAYLELAERLRLPIATADRAMRRGAERLGVPMVVALA